MSATEVLANAFGFSDRRCPLSDPGESRDTFAVRERMSLEEDCPPFSFDRQSVRGYSCDFDPLYIYTSSGAPTTTEAQSKPITTVAPEWNQQESLLAESFLKNDRFGKQVEDQDEQEIWIMDSRTSLNKDQESTRCNILQKLGIVPEANEAAEVEDANSTLELAAVSQHSNNTATEGDDQPKDPNESANADDQDKRVRKKVWQTKILWSLFKNLDGPITAALRSEARSRTGLRWPQIYKWMFDQGRKLPCNRDRNGFKNVDRLFLIEKVDRIKASKALLS